MVLVGDRDPRSNNLDHDAKLVRGPDFIFDRDPKLDPDPNFFGL
jgi:hypothetical protein